MCMSDLGSIRFGAAVKFRYRNTEMSGTFIGVENGIVTIKLSNGYNAGFLPDSIEIIEQSAAKAERKKERTRKVEGARVSILSTGGTIASRVDYSTGAVKPSEDIDWLLESAAFNKNGSRLTAEFRIIENILSENMKPSNWVAISRTIKSDLDAGRSVVVLHGTDTMTYTASAMAFMFRSLSHPVVFTGSQRSSDRPSSDSFLNVEGAISASSSSIGEVAIAMHSSSSDDCISAMRAVRTRKMHSTRRDAFKSIEEGPLATYCNGRLEVNGNHRQLSEESDLDDRMDTSVMMTYFYPGLSASDFESMSSGKKAVVIMGTGLGHIADDLLKTIRTLSRDGTEFLMTTQCIYGRVNPFIYSTGRNLKDAGVTYLGDMLSEVAYVKAMHVLGSYPREQFREIMTANMRGEIRERLRL